MTETELDRIRIESYKRGQEAALPFNSYPVGWNDKLKNEFDQGYKFGIEGHNQQARQVFIVELRARFLEERTEPLLKALLAYDTGAVR